MALAHGLWPFPVLQGLLQQVSACSPETGVCRFWPRCSVSILVSLNSSLTVPSPSCPFQITGVILLAVGVWGKLTLGTYISLIAENSTNAPYVLIGTGTTIVVFGLFGCFATCRGSPWMLKLYAMFLSLVFLAELVAGISGFVFRHEVSIHQVENSVQGSLGGDF
ncbi:PREDICTED: tetraspanin-7-like [Bison bison bison]|uniref:Tetraspanin-7-like n=1 Tax=Bison bison bison TaxID=43346 RepID=A0A6P3JAI2_BISBB|nr:PREDICTED: tetraspanin-7-like [Bison bison bison]